MRPSQLLLFGLAACGGKIAPDASANPGPPPSAAQPQAPAPAPPDIDPEAACQAVCARNGRCGAAVDGCVDDCSADSSTSSTCGAVSRAYFGCFAERLDGAHCSALPPECEDAWCAYAECRGEPLLPYCR